MLVSARLAAKFAAFSLIQLALLGCINTSSSSHLKSPQEAALNEINRVAKRTEWVDSSLRVITRQRTIILGSPSWREFGVMSPSDALEELVKDATSYEAISLAALLDDVKSLREILSEYDNGCVLEDESRLLRRGLSLEDTEKTKRAAKRADALIRIQFESCSPRPTRNELPINHPSSSNPTDTNWPAMTAEAKEYARKQEIAPFVITDSEGLMLGQAFRFSDTEDKNIVIPLYIKEQALAAFNRVQSLLGPLAPDHAITKESSEEMQTAPWKIEFDYEKTYPDKESQKRRRGWFTAVADKKYKTIYLSPTLARASLISCAARVPYKFDTAQQISELLQLVNEGKHLASDVVKTGVIRDVDKMINNMDECLGQELDFLFAHELAHFLLDLPEEDRADCVADAVVKKLGHGSTGIFKTLIFNSAQNTNFEVLGAPESEQKNIICRAKLLENFSHRAAATFEAAVEECKERVSVCY